MVSGISDRLVLRTLDGAADLLMEELRSVCTVRQLSAVAVECTVDGRLGEIADCSLYSTLAISLPGEPGDRDFLRALELSSASGVLATLGTTLTFRVGVEDPEVRRRLITVVERDLGWINRPGGWIVNLTQSPQGWVAEVGPLSWTRRFGRTERLPWSTNSLVAEVLVRLAKVQPGQLVLDPFCGTGTIPRAVRRRQPMARVLGSDHDPRAIEIAIRNRRCDFEIVLAEADALPLPVGGVDRIVSNLPFGKQVGTHRLNRSLYPNALAEIDRVLAVDGRAVLLTEDKRLFHQAIDRQPGLKLIRQRLLKYNGATPTAYILTRPRRSR